MKIFITGGSGLLGRYLQKEFDKLSIQYYSPTHSECDIRDITILRKLITEYKPDIIIHSAAIAKYKDVELNPILGLEVNVNGTTNIAQICIENNIKLVFISTSHVFDGQKGLYDVNDKINPQTKLAKSKAAGEYICAMCDNYLIIRTEFCGVDFPFDTAYVDKWSSKDYIDNIAPLIAAKSISKEIGICHVGGPRKSFYKLAIERNPNVKMGTITSIQKESKVPILVDTSFKL